MFGKLIRNGMVVAAAAGLVAALGAPDDASAQKRVKWKMQSAWGSQLAHLGWSGVRFSKDIEAMSEGKFEVKFFEPGALVPALEAFDAVSKGSVEASWTTPGYHAGKYPGLSFMTTVPFGPGFGEFMAWKMFGGGNAIRDEIYAKHDLMAYDCLAIGPETSGWFKKPVGSIDELKGFKMRFFGLGAKVMQKLGVSTQLLAAADIYPALERGVIDATEFSMPNMDIDLGFYQVAKYNYFPGWHQQASVSELLLNKPKYEELPKGYQAMLKIGSGYQVMFTYAETEALNFGAMEKMQKEHGVIVKRWNDKDLAIFEKAWNEVLAEDSAKDAVFKRFADSYRTFRAKYKIWGEAQAMKATYIE